MNNNYATKIKDSGAGGVQLTASNGLMFQLLATRITSGKTWTYGKAFKKTVRVVGCRAAGGKYEHGAVLGTPTLTNVYVDCRGVDNGFMSTSIDVLAFGW